MESLWQNAKNESGPAIEEKATEKVNSANTSESSFENTDKEEIDKVRRNN